MIVINDRIKELYNISYDDIYILTDFDGTITRDSSDSSWASIFKNPNVTDEFIQESIRIFNYYHKYEIDENIPLEEKMLIMSEWYNKNIETLKKFGITEQTINYSADNESIMSFRDGAKEFLEEMHDKGIPIIVISAGVGNIIQQFLTNNGCNFPNIYICSNFLQYKDGIIQGVRDNNLIHPLNKNEISLPAHIQEKVINRNNIILLGNSISDINMANNKKKTYRIGFLDEKVKDRICAFQEKYDVVCTDNTSYYELKMQISQYLKRWINIEERLEKQGFLEKYNPENLFKKFQNNAINNDDIINIKEVSLVEYKKQGIFKRILDKITKFFKKKSE